MTHLKRKLMMTLALLLTAATGAWAESKPIGLNVEYAAGDEITSTTDVYVYYGEQPGTLKKMGVKITSTQPLKIFMIDAHGFELNGDAAVYYLPDGVATGGYAGGIPCVGESTGDATVVHVASGSGTLTEPYVFAPGPFGTPVPLTRGTGEKINEWTLTNGMPAGNVTVSVDYFPQAEFAKSTDATLAPTAIANVPANTDGAIVEAGTVAIIGTSEVKQGTLMYFVSQPTDNTIPDAPDYDTDGWSENVPTANGLKQGDVYVWYYIKGAEPDNIADRTDDNTRSDSDIKALGTTGFVTLLPEPTYNVEFAEGTNPEAPAEPEWTATPNTGVKKGQTVTVTYTGDRKVIGVKAEKKAAAPAEGKTYTNLQGGEVLHVGDKIAETQGKFRYTHHDNPQPGDYYTYLQSFNTYEVLRADVVKDGYNYKYTESPDGQYYVLKYTYYDDDEEEWFTAYFFNQDLPVTGTSDGITVTLDGQDGSQRNLYTFWVHEPNQ